MTKRIIRCCPPALLFLALMLAAGISQAQQHTTGLPTTKTCPAVAPDPPGSSYDCTFILTNADDQHGVINLSVTDTAPFPGGTPVQVACNQLGAPVTSLGASGSGTESCSGSVTIDPAFNCSQTNAFNQDQINASGIDADTEQFAGLPVAGQATNNTIIPPLNCDDNLICTTDTCSVETGCANAAVVCAPDNNDCTLDPLCDEAVPGSETCPNPNSPASTTCGTDTDGNDCTAPGCDGLGVCQQNHVLDPVSTPCGTDTDGNDCTAPGCTAAGVCDQAHALDPVSTPCGTDGDPTDCTEPGCTAAGVCDQAHIEVAVSTPCGTDTDGIECTVPGCVAGGICSQTHVECPDGEEICRTPGFWGTHAGLEKSTSIDITGQLINAFNDANDPNLNICGREITNADSGNPNSALEAICVSVKGDSRRQLARQLMAAALNCIITQSGDGEACQSLTGALCGGVSVEDVFNACNAACAAGTGVTATVDGNEISCISAIDCFNNGGNFDITDGSCDEAIDSCHENELDSGCFDFSPSGPAGSPRDCNTARKNDIYITE